MVCTAGAIGGEDITLEYAGDVCAINPAGKNKKTVVIALRNTLILSSGTAQYFQISGAGKPQM
jgi:hypothetical protein